MFPKRLTEGYQSFLAGRFHSERSRYENWPKLGKARKS